MTEEVSESHDGVLAVLDKVGLGPVTDVLHAQSQLHDPSGCTHNLLAGVRDRTSDLPLTILVGDTLRMTVLVHQLKFDVLYFEQTYLVEDSNRGVRLAKVDTEDSSVRPVSSAPAQIECLRGAYMMTELFSAVMSESEVVRFR